MNPRQRQDRRGRRTRRILAGIARLAALAVAAVLLPSLKHRLNGDTVAGRGEIRAVDLADGSRVLLGPASVLRPAQTPAERRAGLIDGMAFFEVRADAARPFVVAGGNLAVSASDAATFEVRQAGSYRTVAVAAGEVSLNGEGAVSLRDIRLGPGEAITVDVVTGSSIREPAGAAEVAPWRDRVVVFQRRTVRQAAAEIGRWFNGKVVIWDSALGGKPADGRYDAGDPAAALRAMVEPQGGRVRQITPWLLVLTDGS